MPIPPPSPPLPTAWTMHTVAVPYTELSPELGHRSRVAQNYFNEMERYSEDTHPDSVRYLEEKRPETLTPTYWQATGQASPLPEHIEDGEQLPSYEQAVGAGHPADEEALMFDPALSGRALAQALKHVQRLDELLDNAEQLGALLLGRNEQSGTSIDVTTVASLCEQIDHLRSCWARGQFANSSRLLSQLGGTCVPAYRAEQENALKASIKTLWDVAETEYWGEFLPNHRTADPIMASVYVMAERLKKAEI